MNESFEMCPSVYCFNNNNSFILDKSINATFGEDVGFHEFVPSTQKSTIAADD